MKNSRSLRSDRRPSKGPAREYHFDYSKSRPNRFASEFPKDAVMLVLDSDVAKVFRDSKRVNALLRAAIAALEKRRSRKAG